jgi:DNA-binding NarL/FixJ family response regulator
MVACWQAVKILIADDDVHVRSALQLLLKEQNFVTVGEADSVDELFRLVTESRPDVLLLDWDLSGLGSTPIMQRLLAIRRDLRVIAMSGRPESRAAALRQGVGAFVCKCEAPDALLTALNYAADCGAYEAPTCPDGQP